MLGPVNDDRSLMFRALGLARESVGLASPNPQVGCVLVAPGQDPATPAVILGEGSHDFDRRDHAEIVALKQAAARERDVRGATAYVTLEPCSHHGRTGPCADALIAAGIKRCVVATEDPNPLVSGQGLARLRAAGIDVTLGIEQQAARELNLAFAHFIQHQRPFVTLKAAVSRDGYLAPPPETRADASPHWLTGPEARLEVQRLRHAADAILSGIGTVLADDPLLSDRSGMARRRPLLRVILDPQLRTPATSQLIQSAAEGSADQAHDLLLLCAEDAAAGRERALLSAAAGRAEIMRLPTGPSGRLNLPAVLALLGERRCLSLLVEAGSALNGALLHENLVDQTILFFSPQPLGAGSMPFAAGGPSPFLLEHDLLQAQTSSFGGDTMVRGLLHDPWPAAPGTSPDHLG